MPYYQDMSAAGVGLSGAAGATSLGITGPAQSQSIDGASVLQVVASGGAQVAEATTIRGFGQTLNFAGSAVGSVAIANTTATITLNAGAAGTTITVSQTGTKVGDVLALNFVGPSGNITIASNTATIGISPSSSVSGGMVYLSGTPSMLKTNPTVGVFYDEVDNRLEITGTSSSFGIYSITGTQTFPVPDTNEGLVFMRRRASRVLQNFKGPSGLEFPLQPHIGINRVMTHIPNAGANTVTTYGMIPTVTGALAASTWANTSFSASIQRIEIRNAGVGAGWAGYYMPANVWWLGNAAGLGGFYFVHRGIWSSGTTGSALRMFAGFSTSTAVPVTADPSTQNSFFGVGKDAADTNYFFMHAGSAGAAVKINTNIPRTQGDVFEVRIFAKPGGNAQAGSIGMSFEMLSVGGTGTPGAAGGTYLAEWEATASTNLPAANVALGWRVGVGSTTASNAYGYIGTYIESDN